MSLNVLIIEDELVIAEMLKVILLEQGHNVIDILCTKAELNNFLCAGKHIDIAFCDINLNKKEDGIEISKYLKQNNIPHIYLTSYTSSDIVSRASKTNPINYLTKPFTAKDVEIALSLFISNQLKEFIVNVDGLKHKINASDLTFIKSDNIYLEIHTKYKKHIVRNSLERFIEENSDLNLKKTHRSYAVIIDNISAVNSKYVVVHNQSIPLSRKYKDEITQLFL